MNNRASSRLVLLLAAGVLPAGAIAQTSSPPPDGGINFFIAQRAWFVTWDLPALTSHVVVPNGGTSPVIQTSINHVVLRDVIPVTTLGATSGPWSLSASLSPSIRFESDEIAGGKASRSEYDINLGYAVTPNIVAALIYKGARADSAVRSDSVGIDSFRGRQRFGGFLLGARIHAPIGENLSANATLAYGPGTLKTVNGGPQFHYRYTIADIGVAYRIPEVTFGELSIVAGFRSQSLQFRAETYTISTTNSSILDTRRTKFQTTTQGFTLGVSLVF